MRKNLCKKCCVGTIIYRDKRGKTAFRETVDAEINNVIYMELYSGAKMANGKYRKTYVAGLVDRENTIDFKKAFDSMDRGKLWTIMSSKGIPTLLIMAIQKTYGKHYKSKCR
jgi:hypothetical protein